ncbi:hypothetical protein [Sideroxydans sp. CL21]|uniref:hypothetical protein n=1 Tax=Sideroxydans sp. CL21 TaxID=2600596 RepID=UPI0024BCF9A6|nr:hypothetical protein [Sideroxydans sp. CL21]
MVVAGEVVVEKGAAVGAETVVVKEVVIGAVKVAVKEVVIGAVKVAMDGGEVVAMVGKVVVMAGLLP